MGICAVAMIGRPCRISGYVSTAVRTIILGCSHVDFSMRFDSMRRLCRRYLPSSYSFIPMFLQSHRDSNFCLISLLCTEPAFEYSEQSYVNLCSDNIAPPFKAEEGIVAQNAGTLER